MKRYSVTSAQRRIFFLQTLNKNLTAYNECQGCICQGNLDLERLKWSIKELIRRHDALRASFCIINDQVFQCIHNDIDFEIEIESVDECKITEIPNNFIRPFDLHKAPLMRIKILKIRKDKYIIIRDLHHIVTDRISDSIFWSELFKLYSGAELPETSSYYSDLEIILNAKCNKKEEKCKEEYWLDRFSGELPVLDINTDFPRVASMSHSCKTYQVIIDKENTKKIKEVARHNKTTTYRTLLAAFYVLLSKYSGQDDIIVGTVAARRDAKVSKIMGMFVNTIPLRNFPQEEKTFSTFLKEVTEDSRNAYKYQDYPFDELIDNLKLVSSPNRNPLFDIMFVQNMNMKNIKLDDLEVHEYRIKSVQSKFDIAFSCIDSGSEIELVVEYSSELFSSDTITRMCNHYLNIVYNICADCDKKISDINMMLESEKRQILFDFNKTKDIFPEDKTLHQIVEEQVDSTPDKIALSFNEEIITYSELNKRANSIAYLLRNIGVKRNSIVGIICDRSIEMVTGILGILKSGAAYLPINSEYPDDRIRDIILECDIFVLLAQDKYESRAKLLCKTINLNDANSYRLNEYNPLNMNISTDLAYIIYTSGTTGSPKGVMVEHRQILNTIFDYIKSYNVTSDSVMMFCKNFAFDMSVVEIFACLLTSGRVVILPSKEETNAELVINLILKRRITHLHVITPLINIWFGEKENRKLLKDSSLKYILVGGEEMMNRHVENLIDINDSIEISNGYGPTETAVYSTAGVITKMDTVGVVNIGKPTRNAKIYILSKHGKLQPIGVKGELFIGGISVARGYINSPELTSEKFVKDPFNLGGRMYKTGDYARWRSDGKIEYLGRTDGQLKIRGFRIEISEIERNLLECDGVNEAVVLVKSDADGIKYLCAYVVGELYQTSSQIKAALSLKLPEYMIPSVIIMLDSMPMKPNGKIDKQILLRMQSAQGNALQYIGPDNEIEHTLLYLWEKVLGISGISVTDNFFEIGGHSLSVVILSNEIKKKFGVQIKIESFFRYTNIKEQASLIANAEVDELVPLQRVEDKEYYETTDIQRRIYTVQQLDNSQTIYNECRAYVWSTKLDVARLKHSFNELVKRHESLRTSFDLVNGRVVQRIHKNVQIEIDVQDADEALIQEYIHSFIRPFDLHTVPLIRVKVLRLNGERYMILRDMHHIITDIISETIFWDELVKLYYGIELDKLDYRYRDYALWQSRRKSTTHWKQSEIYWMKVLAGKIPTLDLSADYPRPARKSYAGAKYIFKMDSEKTAKLRRLAQNMRATTFMVLLATFNILLFKRSGQRDIIVGSPVNNRGHIYFHNIIGMFANTLPFRNYPEEKKTFEEFLQEIKTNTLNILEYQEFSYDELLDRLNIERSLNRNPLYDVVFQKSYIKCKDRERILNSFNNNKSKFDLTLNTFEDENEINFLVEYSTELFTESTIVSLCDHYLEILDTIYEDSSVQLSNISKISSKEKSQIVSINSAVMPHQLNYKSIQALFEEQVRIAPDKIALVFEDRVMTYEELNNRANIIAFVLREKGAKPNTIIAMMLDKSFEMIVGILSILKSGAAYLPIDPEYPNERIDYILAESRPLIVLTQDKYVNKVQASKLIVNLDDIDVYSNNVGNISNVNTPQDLAYIIYTSGSTGTPKGVMIEHRNVLALIENGEKLFQLSSRDIWTMFHSYCFDFSVWEMYGCLLLGGKLILIPKRTARNPEKFRQILHREKVTILNQTPHAFYALSQEEMLHKDDNLFIRKIIFGGEELDFSKLRTWNEKYPNTQMINMYGITETTVHVTYKIITKNEIELGQSTIGKPLPTYKILIVDENLNLVPRGVPGEIIVGGSGVARGYLYHPELTAERFVTVPYFHDEIMYRSGDIGRYLENGDLEYLGRIDDQVKIRGYRIEIAEVEKKLLECNGIREAVVIQKKGADDVKYLCGYVVADSSLKIAILKSQLLTKLPEYMIPNFINRVEYIPLTSNGKVDKNMLRNIADQTDNEILYVAPSNEIETRLSKIWQQVIGLSQIGLYDNFFDIGGQSLKAIILANEISREFDIEFGVEDIFKTPTIKAISDIIIEGGFRREPYLIYNHDGKETVFCFPPYSSYGIVYKELAALMNNIRMVCFNFHLVDNIIEYYASLISQIMRNEYVDILAYSAGGTLALEVANELERRGICVRNVILLDSYVNDYETNNLEMTHIERFNYSAKEFSNIINYKNYYDKKKVAVVLSATISLLKAEGRGNNVNDYYQNMTQNIFKTYMGSGGHYEMLTGEHLIYNAAIIKDIIEME